MHRRRLGPIVVGLMLVGLGCSRPVGGGQAGASPSDATPRPSATSLAAAPPSNTVLTCGQYASLAPASGAPTPNAAASADVAAGTSPPVTVIGAWPTCFRPAAVTIRTGELVQWQEATWDVVQVRLDDGLELGPILHVLEVRFNRPGSYPYHGNPGSGAVGTISVVGTPRSGPALEIWVTGRSRTVADLPGPSPTDATSAPTIQPTVASAHPSGQASCAVTKPISAFVPPPPYLASPPDYYRSAWFGSAALWTMLNVDGEVWNASSLPHGQGLSQKTFWWSAEWSLNTEPAPPITVVGTRLDGPGSFRFSPGTNASADFGTAMLVGVEFPTPGCWQVTGRYRDALLSYVVWIKDQ